MSSISPFKNSQNIRIQSSNIYLQRSYQVHRQRYINARADRGNRDRNNKDYKRQGLLRRRMKEIIVKYRKEDRKQGERESRINKNDKEYIAIE